MRMSEAIGIDWKTLSGRLDAADALQRWAASELELGRFGCMSELAAVVHRGDPERADAIVGALVRMAAAGRDPDSVLVLLHLLAPGARRLAQQLNDLSADIELLVVGELALQIQESGRRQGTRAHAAGLLFAVRRALLRELLPYQGRGRVQRVVVMDPVRLAELQRSLESGEAVHCGAAPLDVVLAWAIRSDQVSRRDVALLVDVARAGHGGGPRVAAEHGISERTMRRRARRTRSVLRAARRGFRPDASAADIDPVAVLDLCSAVKLAGSVA